MENNKLKTNLLKTGVTKIGSKIAKIVPPAILTAALLNMSTYANAKATNQQETKAPTPIYRDAKTVNNYELDTKSFVSIYDSKIFNLQDYTIREVEVRKELNKLLADMNKSTLKLAAAYKSLERQSINNSNLTVQEIEHIAQNHGKDTSNQENLSVAKSVIQHYMHLMLDTMSLVRVSADSAEITVIDENDGQNEYLRFNAKGTRNIREESDVVLDLAKKDLLAFAEYGMMVANHNTKDAATINNNLLKIKALASQKQQDKTTCQSLMNLAYGTADLLPNSLFGTTEMRRALIIEFASQYTFNNQLTNLEKLGYDITNLNPGELAKDNVALDALGVGVEVLKDRAIPSLDATGIAKLPNNFDLKFGGEANFDLGYYDGQSFQALAKVEPGYTFQATDHRLSLPVKGGLEVSLNDGSLSTPFGFGATYSIPLNNKLSIDFGSSVMFNIQKNNVGLSPMMINATFNTGKFKIKFGIGYTHNISLNKNSASRITDPTINDPIINNPIIPDEPVIENPPVVDKPVIDEGFTSGKPITSFPQDRLK